MPQAPGCEYDVRATIHAGGVDTLDQKTLDDVLAELIGEEFDARLRELYRRRTGAHVEHVALIHVTVEARRRSW